jgi:hypothetical protein
MSVRQGGLVDPAYLWDEGVRLRRVQGRAQRVYRSPGRRSEGQPDQAELVPPRAGRVGRGWRGGPDGGLPGGKTGVQLATLPDDEPTGGFSHLGETLPW